MSNIYFTPPAVMDFIKSRTDTCFVFANPPFSHKEYYQKPKAARKGTCFRCGQSSRAFICAPCNDWRNEQRRAKRLVPFRNCACGQQATLFRMGDFLCSSCHVTLIKAQDENNSVDDDARNEARKARSLRYRQWHKKAGLCVECPAPAVVGNTRCEKHHNRHRTWGSSKSRL